MVKINHYVSSCVTALTLIILAILSFFKPDFANSTKTIDLIANVTYIFFLCVFAACSFKINLSSTLVAGYLIVVYLGDFYNSGSGGHFTQGIDGLFITLITAISVGQIPPLLRMVIDGYGKEKIIAIAYIFLTIIAYFCGIMVIAFAYEYKWLYYTGGIIGPIIYIVLTNIISRFYLRNQLD